MQIYFLFTILLQNCSISSCNSAQVNQYTKYNMNCAVQVTIPTKLQTSNQFKNTESMSFNNLNRDLAFNYTLQYYCKSFLYCLNKSIYCNTCPLRQYKDMEGNAIEVLIDTQISKDKVGIYYREIGDQGMSYLTNRHPDHIKQLWLAFNNISDIGMFMFQHVNWSNITHLNLSGNKIKNKGCYFLSRTSIPQLKWLRLSKNSIEGQGVHHLSKTNWHQLYFIDLSEGKIAVGGINSFIRSNWKQLKAARICMNRIKHTQALKLALSEFTYLSEIRFDFFQRQQRNPFFKTNQKDKVQNILKKKFAQYSGQINSPFQ